MNERPPKADATLLADKDFGLREKVGEGLAVVELHQQGETQNQALVENSVNNKPNLKFLINSS